MAEPERVRLLVRVIAPATLAFGSLVAVAGVFATVEYGRIGGLVGVPIGLVFVGFARWLTAGEGDDDWIQRMFRRIPGLYPTDSDRD